MNQNVDDLRSLVSGCFGDMDLTFATHSLDVQRAKDLLIQCLERDIPLRTYLSFFEDYLTDTGASKEHIRQQLDRIKNLSSYFTKN